MRAIAAGLILGVMVTASAQNLPAHKGYLKPGTVDIMSVLPAGPVVGDPRYDADRAIFKATRRYVGTPRWEMATKDVSWKDADMLADFSCSLGTTVTPKDVPHILALVHRAGDDTQHETNIAKNANKRQRPFLIDAGEICQPAKELADSYDYPSGHTTGGWTWALVLADVAPDRASQILTRGRAYGESRIVCGAHNASAVEAGRLSATVTMTSVRETAAYRSDLRKAQAEFKALKKTAPDAHTCEAERGLMALNIFAPVQP
jgi:acid phosphatase (class A)